jgi:hypothetical protein
VRAGQPLSYQRAVFLFSAGLGVSIHLSMVSRLICMLVKATETAERWNPSPWKTEMFYANLLAGFAVQ